jgi:hypothetical protein
MSQYIASLSPKDLEVLQAFANATGLDVKSNTEIFLYYDVIGIQHCQFGLPFPSWFVQMEEKLRPFYLSMFTFGSATVELERLFNGPLWNEILRNFDARLEVERRSNETIVELRGDEIPNVRLAKMYTFSAHDTTISNMLNNLGVYDDQEPPAYNSAILFELHRNSSNSNGTTPSEYLVKVLFPQFSVAFSKKKYWMWFVNEEFVNCRCYIVLNLGRMQRNLPFRIVTLALMRLSRTLLRTTERTKRNGRQNAAVALHQLVPN